MKHCIVIHKMKYLEENNKKNKFLNNIYLFICLLAYGLNNEKK